jgi:hypothetical protein
MEMELGCANPPVWSLDEASVTQRHCSRAVRKLTRSVCAALLTLCLGQCPAQIPASDGGESQKSPQSTTGMANAGPHEPQFDEQHRPITAGGFVKNGPIIFQNVADPAGLTKWHHLAGTPEKRIILEAKGPGLCLLDYDNDGWLDIYLVNGSTYDALSGKQPAPHAALFHNSHDGNFTETTPAAGVANDRWATVVRWEIMTTMGGRISMSRTMARTAFFTTIMTAPSPTLPRLPAFRLALGRPEQHSVTTMETADSTSS